MVTGSKGQREEGGGEGKERVDGTGQRVGGGVCERVMRLDKKEERGGVRRGKLGGGRGGRGE